MNFAFSNEILPLPKGILQPYAYYGVHLEHRMNERVYIFRYYHPTAESVFLVSGFLSWETGKKMTRLADGVFELFLTSDRSLEGECYKFRALIGGESVYLTDPFATAEEGQGEGASLVACEIPRALPIVKEKGDRPLHLLEVSLTSFMTRNNRLPLEQDGACSYRALAEKLVIYAKSTGYTHLKLLCRDADKVSSLFAPSPRHGTPEAFSAFVTTLHDNGVRLIASFYYPDTDRRTELTLSAAAWFLSQYAFDGIYFEENPSRVVSPLFAEGLSRLKFRYPDALFVGDRHPNILLAESRDASREDAFVSLLTTPFDTRRKVIPVLFASLSPSNAFSSQSKALTRGGERSLMESFVGSYEQKFAQSRLYQLLLIVSRGAKLSFMGQSLAPFRPWREENLPEWFMADFKLHRAHRRYIRALNQLYLESPSLYASERRVTPCFFDEGRLIFALKIASRVGELLVVANASDRHAANYALAVTAASYTELFSSDEESFAGEGYVNRLTLEAQNGLLHLDLAPLSAVILQPRL